MSDLNDFAARHQELTTEKILALLRNRLPDLADRYQVKSLGVFGSYIHGNVNQDSDLDILVDFQSPPTLFQFIRLQNELSDLLSVPVDLVMRKSLKPNIGKQIIAEVVDV